MSHTEIFLRRFYCVFFWMINAFAVLICLLCPTGDFKVNQKVSRGFFLSWVSLWSIFLCYLLFVFRRTDGWRRENSLVWETLCSPNNGKTMKTWQFFKLFSLLSPCRPAQPPLEAQRAEWTEEQSFRLCQRKSSKHSRLAWLLVISNFFHVDLLLCIFF